MCDINGSSESDLENASSIKSGMISNRFTDYDTTRKQNDTDGLNQIHNSSSKKELFPVGEDPEEKKQFRDMRIAYL